MTDSFREGGTRAALSRAPFDSLTTQLLRYSRASLPPPPPPRPGRPGRRPLEFSRGDPRRGGRSRPPGVLRVVASDSPPRRLARASRSASRGFRPPPAPRLPRSYCTLSRAIACATRGRVSRLRLRAQPRGRERVRPSPLAPSPCPPRSPESRARPRAKPPPPALVRVDVQNVRGERGEIPLLQTVLAPERPRVDERVRVEHRLRRLGVSPVNRHGAGEERGAQLLREVPNLAAALENNREAVPANGSWYCSIGAWAPPAGGASRACRGPPGSSRARARPRRRVRSPRRRAR